MLKNGIYMLEPRKKRLIKEFCPLYSYVLKNVWTRTSLVYIYPATVILTPYRSWKSKLLVLSLYVLIFPGFVAWAEYNKRNQPAP